MAGPLQGLRVIEMAGIGPAPFCAMLLADMGADVVRIDRRQAVDLGLPDQHEEKFETLLRGRRSAAVDLKSAEGRDVVLAMLALADVLLEGFRPGVMERLGLGPDAALARNPRLVYGRMTGYGQDGPLAAAAGHDITYIALTGVLGAIGPAGGRPVPPLNLIGDFGGGGMLLAFGVLAALNERQRSGRGQVVDAAMVEGAAYLASMVYSRVAAGSWREERGANALDGGAPWYDTYATRDGQYMAVGAIEGRFYAELLDRLGLANAGLPDQHDRARWPVLRAKFAEAFAGRARAEWEQVFAGSDACVVPVLSWSEAPRHPHNAVRGVFIERDGVPQPAPAPRFSRTPPQVGAPPRPVGADTRAVLVDYGLSETRIDDLIARGIVGTDGTA
jgi:alpha-methylacyl-CoA racemase